MWQKHGATYQLAVVVLAVSAVLDVVCVRPLFLAEQPCELGTVAENRVSRVKKRDKKKKKGSTTIHRSLRYLDKWQVCSALGF